MSWNQINLTQKYRFPDNLPGSLQDMPFPDAKFPAHWYGYKTTSLAYQSEQLEKIKGISFRGLVEPWDRQNAPKGGQNEFAIFYNQTPTYHGGPEFGWVFRVDQKEVLFYTLTDANIKGKQIWNQWSASGGKLGEGIKNQMNHPGEERFWNIEIIKDGDFLLSLINPKDWSQVTATIKRPDSFPDLSNYEGTCYLTVGAQKFQDTSLTSYPHLKINEVKVLK